MSSINCSDIAVVCSITSLLQVGRAEGGMDSTESLNLMCFYADHIDIGSCREFFRVSELLDKIKQACGNHSRYFDIFSKMVHISSIDDLVSIMGTVKYYFSVDVSVNPNGACAPFMVKYDSLLGLYLRRILVKWEVLSYGEISFLYSLYRQHFLADGPTAVDYNDETIPFRADSVQPPMAIAQVAMLSGDIFPALENIHAYCDQSADDPLRSKADVLSGGLDALNSLMKGLPDPKSRHQQAMLSLANMWVRGGYFGQASIATEEGMKMAHQLGDHASVARALLLLYYVVEGMEQLTLGDTAADSRLSAEEVLLRCLQRCVELNMRQLEIQATLLLIRLRSRWPLYACVAPRLGFAAGSYDVLPLSSELSGSYDMDQSTQRSRVPPYSLWTLLSSTVLDESLQKGKGHLSSHSNSQKPTQNNPKQKKKTIDPALLVDTDYSKQRMSMLAHAAFVESELWVRLGVHAMAALALRRALRQVSVFVDADMVVHLSLRLVEVLSKSNCDGAAISIAHCLETGDGQETSQVICQDIMKQCHLMATSCDLCSSTRRLIRYTSIAMQIRTALLCGPSDDTCMRQAVRDGLVLCEIVGDVINHSPDQLFYARIMRCAVNSYFDCDSALIEAKNIYADAARAGYSLWKGEAMVLMAVLHLRSDTRMDIPTGVCVIQSLIELNRAEYIPSVETALVVLVNRLCNIVSGV